MIRPPFAILMRGNGMFAVSHARVRNMTSFGIFGMSRTPRCFGRDQGLNGSKRSIALKRRFGMKSETKPLFPVQALLDSILISLHSFSIIASPTVYDLTFCPGTNYRMAIFRPLQNVYL